MKWRLALVFAFAASFLLFSAFTESPTVDEPFHLTRGLAFWWTGDTRLFLAHPPLANALEALPAALSEKRVDFRAWNGWNEANVVALADVWLKADYPQFRRALLSARVVASLLALLLLAYLTAWAWRFFGERAAFFVALLGAFHPLLLAHGRLMTTDLPVALLTAIALGETVRWLVDRSRRAYLRAVLATGAAVATKYSALLLPIFLIGAWCLAYRRQGPFADRQWRRFGFACAGLLGACLLAINAAYLFQRTGWRVQRILDERPPVNYLTIELGNQLLRKYSPLERLPGGLRLPLPYPFVAGIASIRRQNDEGGSVAWFWGRVRPGGVPGYHALMILIKSPLIFVLLLLGSLAFLGERRALDWRQGIWLSFAFVYLAACAGAHINLGARHALPALPPLLLLAAFFLDRWWERSGRRGRIVASVLLAEMVLSTSAAFPEFIGYFNWLVGGREYGHRISMVAEDWGQDARRAGRWLQAQPPAPLFVQPYSLVVIPEIQALGLPAVRYTCGQTLPIGARLVLNRGMMLRMSQPCFREDQTRLLTTVNQHIEIREVIAN